MILSTSKLVAPDPKLKVPGEASEIPELTQEDTEVFELNSRQSDKEARVISVVSLWVESSIIFNLASVLAVSPETPMDVEFPVLPYLTK